MKKEIDLFKLQNIVNELAMQNKSKFRCRGCNRPFSSIIDAYSCSCKVQKKVFWSTNASKTKPAEFKKKKAMITTTARLVK
jgi:hypothetical protein